MIIFGIFYIALENRVQTDYSVRHYALEENRVI